MSGGVISMCKRCKEHKKYLPETHPELIKEWHKEKNGDLRPEDITYGSRKMVHWRCGKEDCGYRWSTRMYCRTGKKPTGCPACNGKVVNRKNSLALNFRSVSEEWYYPKNKGLKPEQVTYGSCRAVYWKCKDCGYVWKARIADRVKGSGCPVEAGKAVTEKNSLASISPEVAKDWDKDENGDLTPETITNGSNRRVHWKCRKKVCRYKWRATVNDRTNVKKSGCPACSGRVATETNNFELANMDYSDEWHPTKNLPLLPNKVTVAARTKIHWICRVPSCKYEWVTTLKSRFKGRGCPICNKGPVSKSSQDWLDSLNINVREHKIEVGDSFIRVDGFCPREKIVYEFLGDYWHGNPKKYSAEEINPTNKKSYGKLHQEWLDRKTLLEDKGYKVVYIWESDFLKS